MDDLDPSVRAALDAVWSTQGRRFASFERGADTPDEVFVQYLDGELNLTWPFRDAPERRLRPWPSGVSVLAWRPAATAILAVGDLCCDDVAALVVRLLHLLPGRGEVEVRVLDR